MAFKILGTFTVGKYRVTCAEWKPEEFASYEIGIRDTSLEYDQRGHFYLIQSDYFRAFNILHYGALAASMLNHGQTPSDVNFIFGVAENLEKNEIQKTVI